MRPLQLAVLFPLARLFARLARDPFPPFHSLLHALVVEALACLRLARSAAHQLPSLLVLAFCLQHAAALMRQDLALVLDTLLALRIAPRAPGFAVLLHALSQLLDALPDALAPKLDDALLDAAAQRLVALSALPPRPDRLRELAVLLLFLQKALSRLDLAAAPRYRALQTRFPRLSHLLVALATASQPQPPAGIPFFSLEPQCAKQCRRLAVVHRHYLPAPRGGGVRSLAAARVQQYRESAAVSLCGVAWEAFGPDLRPVSPAGEALFWRELRLSDGLACREGDAQPVRLLAAQLLSYFALRGLPALPAGEAGVSAAEELLGFHRAAVHRLRGEMRREIRRGSEVGSRGISEA